MYWCMKDWGVEERYTAIYSQTPLSLCYNTFYLVTIILVRINNTGTKRLRMIIDFCFEVVWRQHILRYSMKKIFQ